MKRIKLIVIVCMSSWLVSCHITGVKTKGNLKRIQYSLTMPSIINGYYAVDTAPKVYRIIDAGDCVLYELPHFESFEENEIDSNGQIKAVAYKDTFYFDLFVFRKTDSYGYMVKNLADSFCNRKKIDSVIGVRTFKDLDVANMLQMGANFDQVVKQSKNVFIRKYVAKDTAYDSLYYYFDNRLKTIAYSISPRLDSSFHSKVYKLEGLLKKDTSARGTYLNRYKKIVFQLSEIEVPNQKEFTNFFARFKKEKCQ
jgi:hypothetical protein